MLLGVNSVQSWWSWIPVCQQISLKNPVTCCHSYDPSSLLALDRMEALEGPQRSISVGGALRSPGMIVRRTMSATCNFHSSLSCTFYVAVDSLSCTSYVAVDFPTSIIRIGQDSDNISLVHRDIHCPRRSHYRYRSVASSCLYWAHYIIPLITSRLLMLILIHWNFLIPLFSKITI